MWMAAAWSGLVVVGGIIFKAMRSGCFFSSRTEGDRGGMVPVARHEKPRRKGFKSISASPGGVEMDEILGHDGTNDSVKSDEAIGLAHQAQRVQKTAFSERKGENKVMALVENYDLD